MIKKELKKYNIHLNKLTPTNDIYSELERAISYLHETVCSKHLEVILNGNLVRVKNKLDGNTTIFGCKVSLEPLEQDISFIVRPYVPEPDYKQLYFKLKERIEELTYL